MPVDLLWDLRRP